MNPIVRILNDAGAAAVLRKAAWPHLVIQTPSEFTQEISEPAACIHLYGAKSIAHLYHFLEDTREEWEEKEKTSPPF